MLRSRLININHHCSKVWPEQILNGKTTAACNLMRFNIVHVRHINANATFLSCAVIVAVSSVDDSGSDVAGSPQVAIPPVGNLIHELRVIRVSVLSVCMICLNFCIIRVCRANSYQLSHTLLLYLVFYMLYQRGVDFCLPSLLIRAMPFLGASSDLVTRLATLQCQIW